MDHIKEWDEKYSVDIPELDECQKEILSKFNTLIELKVNKADAKTVTNMISEINDFSKMYFAKEEKLLRKRKYPDLDTHSKAHRQFIKNSISLRREIAEDVENLTMEVIVELRDWLVDHIETSDSLYVPFLRIHQYIDDVDKK
ncbi:MAG: bacteriohemerythrin [Desulfobacterales bacterium]|nr:bacteriohemerythrin [Desulfobacterales bacterium]